MVYSLIVGDKDNVGVSVKRFECKVRIIGFEFFYYWFLNCVFGVVRYFLS